MTDGLNGNQVKFLTYLVYVLLTILTIVVAWQAVTIAQIPDKYVRLERYGCDVKDVKERLKALDTKLDRYLGYKDYSPL